MKKKYIFIILIVLCLFFFNTIDIFATSISRSVMQSIGNDYNYWEYKGTSNGVSTNVFCVKQGDSHPTECSGNNVDLYNRSDQEALRVSIGYIIQNFGSSDYGKAQYLIHKILAEKVKTHTSVPGNKYPEAYENAQKVYDDYINQIPGTYYLTYFESCKQNEQPITYGLDPKYINGIYHWAWGFTNNEGNNDDKNAFHLKTTSFSCAVQNCAFQMNKDRAVEVPNGFYLKESFGTSDINGSWTSYPIPMNVSQAQKHMSFEYDYSPYNYTITYNLNGGTNSSNNPSTYNVLYGVDFENPTREGYEFKGWYKDADFNEKITGINEGANASFSSSEDLYEKLSLRSTGDVTVYAKWEPLIGSIKVSKINTKKEPIMNANINFALYTSSGCDDDYYGEFECSTGGDGTCTTDVFRGDYWIKEQSISKSPYVSSGECKEVGWVGAEETKLVEYVNKTQCEIDLEKLGNSPSVENLLGLYKTYPTYNGLLNFSNPSCSPVECSTSSNLSCLEGTISSSSKKIGENNLSCYSEAIRTNNGYGNYIGFCGWDIKVSKNFIPDYYSENWTGMFYSNAGQFLIKQDKQNQTISIFSSVGDTVKSNIPYFAHTYLTRTCYVLKDKLGEYNVDSTGHFTIYENKDVENVLINDSSVDEPISLYFGDANDDGVDDKLEIETFPSYVTRTPILKQSFYELKYEDPFTYNLNVPIYLEKITGKYSSIKTDKTTQTPIYGILSKFNQTSGIIPFSVEYKGEIYEPDEINKCKYYVTPEVITYNDKDKGELEIEFRTIDTSNPFNRDPKKNWKTTSSENKVVKYITNIDVNNSYNRTGEGSLYQTGTTGKIVLTPELVKKIREYNELNLYDDYTVYEEEDESGKKQISTAFFDYIGLTKVQ